MVETEEMQHAVNDKMGGMIGERDALRLGLALHRLGGKHDIAKRAGLFAMLDGARREGQDVGGSILAPPGAVQVAHLRIVGEHERRLERARPRRGQERCRRRARQLRVGKREPVPDLGAADDLDAEPGSM